MSGQSAAQWSELERLRQLSPMFDAVIDEIDGREIRIGERWLTDYASCNYLGLDLDPQIAASIDEQVRRWGTHPSWSRLLGSPRIYIELEEQLTQLLGAPDALALPTVTLIHSSVIPVLAGAGTVLLERSGHRSLYDGCRMATVGGANMARFADLDQLTDLLRVADHREPRLVCVDGVNSMTGDPADVPALLAICRDFGATLYLDDAHGFGVIGQRQPDEACPYGMRGNGIVRYTGSSYEDVILVGGFSKAYSSLLAFIAAPTGLKNLLKVAAPPYLYSGPSPTASLATVLAGFAVNRERGDALRSHLHALTARVLAHLAALGVRTLNTSGLPIVELPIAPGRDLADIAAKLWRHGIYVTLAAYPLVSRAAVGFRLQLTAAHTMAQVDRLNAVLTELAADGDLRSVTFVDKVDP